MNCWSLQFIFSIVFLPIEPTWRSILLNPIASFLLNFLFGSWWFWPVFNERTLFNVSFGCFVIECSGAVGALYHLSFVSVTSSTWWLTNISIAAGATIIASVAILVPRVVLFTLSHGLHIFLPILLPLRYFLILTPVTPMSTRPRTSRPTVTIIAPMTPLILPLHRWSILIFIIMYHIIIHLIQTIIVLSAVLSYVVSSFDGGCSGGAWSVFFNVDSGSFGAQGVFIVSGLLQLFWALFWLGGSGVPVSVLSGRVLGLSESTLFFGCCLTGCKA